MGPGAFAEEEGQEEEEHRTPAMRAAQRPTMALRQEATWKTLMPYFSEFRV